MMKETFAQRLKSLRTEHGFSQRDIAHRLNVVQVSYLRWEQGKTEPNINNICELSRLFGVTADYLLGNTDESDMVEANAEPSYTADEKKLLESYRQLDNDKQSALLRFLR